MSNPCYDMRLVHKCHSRTPDEIEDFLAQEYVDFLEKKILNGDVWALLARLNPKNQKDALDDLVQRVLDQNGCGRKDKEFMAGFTADEIEYEYR